MSIPQDFVEHVAELPAENGAAGQRETQSVGPEGVSSFLPMSPQDDSWSCIVNEPKPQSMDGYSTHKVMELLYITCQDYESSCLVCTGDT